MEDTPANVPAHYEILEVLHQGSSGAVLKVRNTLLGEVRVLKVLRDEIVSAPGFRERFAALARDLPKLDHPNLVKIFGIHLLDSGQAYLEMEYVEGHDLGRELGNGDSPSLDDSLSIARQSLDALAFLHQNEQVHGMVSPDHLLVTGNGQREVKLLHTGVVGVVELEDADILGRSWHYASPEQRIPGRRVTPRSDTYSMGMVLCQLLAEIDPYSDDEVANLDSILANGSIELPEPLRKMLRQAIREHPDDRFGCANSFAEALSEIQDGQTLAGPASHGGREPSETDGESRAAKPRSNRPDLSSNGPDERNQASQATQIATLRLRAEEFVAEHRFAEALHTLRQAEAIDPDDRGLKDLTRVVREAGIAPLLGEGARDILAGDRNSAQRKIDQALRLDPKHERALAMKRQLTMTEGSGSRGGLPTATADEPTTDTATASSAHDDSQTAPRGASKPSIEVPFQPPAEGALSPSTGGQTGTGSRSFMETMRASPSQKSTVPAASIDRAATSPPRDRRIQAATRFPWMAGVGLLALVAAVLIWFPEPAPPDPPTTQEGEGLESAAGGQPVGADPIGDEIQAPRSSFSAAGEASADAPRRLDPVEEPPMRTQEFEADRGVVAPPSVSDSSGPQPGTPNLDQLRSEEMPTEAPTETSAPDDPAPQEIAPQEIALQELALEESSPQSELAEEPAPQEEADRIRFERTESFGETAIFDSTLRADRFDAVVPPEIIEDPSDEATSKSARSDDRTNAQIAAKRALDAKLRELTTPSPSSDVGDTDPPSATVSTLPTKAPPEPGASKPSSSVASALSSIPSPVVVEPPPPSAELQEEKIRSTLDRFEKAHTAIDMGALRAIWPSLQGSQLQALSESFADAKTMKTKVRDCDYEVQRGTATARCVVGQTYRPVGGKRHSVERRITFLLRRTGDRWVIENLAPTP